MNASDKKRAEVIQGMRDLANFLEENPDVKFDAYPGFTAFVKADELPVVARKIGAAEKVASDMFYSLRKWFGPICMDWTCDREQVCQKVATGTRVIPAEPERTVVLPAKPEREEVVYEWKCPDSLLAKVSELTEAVTP